MSLLPDAIRMYVTTLYIKYNIKPAYMILLHGQAQVWDFITSSCFYFTAVFTVARGM